MVTTPAQKVLCPVCHQADQVKNVATAYESGVSRLAPPTMPVAHVGMMKFVIVGFALVGVGVFFILVLSGTNGYGSWPLAIQIVQVVITILAICAALALSLVALLRVVRGDMNSQKLLPAYDEALENWRRLYYCKRDDAVFDPQTNKTISDASLKSLISIDENIHHMEQTQQTAVSHQ
jgi:amino acid transporter